MRYWFLDTLDQRCGPLLQLKVVVYQHLDRIRNYDSARRGQARDPRSQVGGQPVNVVMGGVQIHQPTMYPHPDIDLDREPALRLIAEAGHLPRDLQTGVHRSAHVVLVGNRVTEDSEQSVTVCGSDVPLVSV